MIETGDQKTHRKVSTLHTAPYPLQFSSHISQYRD